MQEVWKPVVGYEGMYEVSNLGRVKSIPRKGTIKKERFLIPNDNGCGYLKLSLSNYSKTTKYIHILVAESFLNYQSNKGAIAVDHIDNNKKNNILSNLRILSHRENILRSKKSNTNNSNIYKVRNKYRVRIAKNDFGYYNSIEDAIKVRDNQLNKL
jgi:hypothetical protein